MKKSRIASRLRRKQRLQPPLAVPFVRGDHRAGVGAEARQERLAGPALARKLRHVWLDSLRRARVAGVRVVRPDGDLRCVAAADRIERVEEMLIAHDPRRHRAAGNDPVIRFAVHDHARVLKRVEQRVIGEAGGVASGHLVELVDRGLAADAGRSAGTGVAVLQHVVAIRIEAAVSLPRPRRRGGVSPREVVDERVDGGDRILQVHSDEADAQLGRDRRVVLPQP